MCKSLWERCQSAAVLETTMQSSRRRVLFYFSEIVNRDELSITRRYISPTVRKLSDKTKTGKLRAQQTRQREVQSTKEEAVRLITNERWLNAMPVKFYDFYFIASLQHLLLVSRRFPLSIPSSPFCQTFLTSFLPARHHNAHIVPTKQLASTARDFRRKFSRWAHCLDRIRCFGLEKHACTW